MKASEWKERTLLGLWWLMFGAATVWLLIGSIAYWSKHGWLPVEAASWVQAFGSIGAILVAAWAALHASQAQRRQADRAHRDRVLVIKGSLHEVARRGKAYAEILRGELIKPDSPMRTHLIQMAGNELEAEWRRSREIPITDMPSADLIQPLVQMVFNLETGARLARMAIEYGEGEELLPQTQLLNENLEEFLRIFSDQG